MGGRRIRGLRGTGEGEGEAKGGREWDGTSPLPVETLKALPRPLVRFHLMKMVAQGKLSPEEGEKRYREAVGASSPGGS